jgi:hypothetical protein
MPTARRLLPLALPALAACSHVDEKGGTEVHLHMADEAPPALLTEATLSPASLELIECAVSTSPIDWIIPSARAHHPTSSATGLHLEAPVDLMTPGAALGAISPPAGDYCALRVVIEPLGSAGTSLTVAQGGDAAAEGTSAGSAWLDLSLSPQLTLDEDHLEAEVHVSAALAAWPTALANAAAQGLTEPQAVGDAVLAEIKGQITASAD